MYAIVEAGGRQYKVSPGEIIKVDSLSADKNQDIILEKVLMINKEDKVVYGSPYINGAKVTASVEDTGKLQKVIVYKQRPRKVYRKLRGHRQNYSSLKIKEIILGD